MGIGWYYCGGIPLYWGIGCYCGNGLEIGGDWMDLFALDNTGGQRVVDFSCFFLLLLFENWKDWKTEDCNWFEFIRNPGSRVRNQIRNWENKREWKSEWSSVFESLRWLAVWFTAEIQWKWGVIGGIWFRISDFGFREWARVKTGAVFSLSVLVAGGRSNRSNAI